MDRLSRPVFVFYACNLPPRSTGLHDKMLRFESFLCGSAFCRMHEQTLACAFLSSFPFFFFFLLGTWSRPWMQLLRTTTRSFTFTTALTERCVFTSALCVSVCLCVCVCVCVCVCACVSVCVCVCASVRISISKPLSSIFVLACASSLVHPATPVPLDTRVLPCRPSRRSAGCAKCTSASIESTRRTSRRCTLCMPPCSCAPS